MLRTGVLERFTYPVNVSIVWLVWIQPAGYDTLVVIHPKTTIQLFLLNRFMVEEFGRIRSGREGGNSRLVIAEGLKCYDINQIFVTVVSHFLFSFIS